ncbi:hypothetical protein DRP04_11560 [Archaeoglobales archaeon]|nr:MAG: hypothetical protein DRP04_11560 [Archaeoglobales archaeon]
MVEWEYECSRDAILGSKYCIFHDKNYWRKNPDHVRQEFYKIVEDAILNKKELICIGFNLPDINLEDVARKLSVVRLEFKKDVYFDYTKFHGMSDFQMLSLEMPTLKNLNLADWLCLMSPPGMSTEVYDILALVNLFSLIAAIVLFIAYVLLKRTTATFYVESADPIVIDTKSAEPISEISKLARHLKSDIRVEGIKSYE